MCIGSVTLINKHLNSCNHAHNKSDLPYIWLKHQRREHSGRNRCLMSEAVMNEPMEAQPFHSFTFSWLNVIFKNNPWQGEIVVNPFSLRPYTSIYLFCPPYAQIAQSKLRAGVGPGRGGMMMNACVKLFWLTFVRKHHCRRCRCKIFPFFDFVSRTPEPIDQFKPN